ncbi:hypothetical protein BX661DRAFT_191852 [Kickxella alabastrina]|uniref:uncharacterized protein n=1 Tax=Kickxella alabastrina TaxID=61397 RepID=UPI0022200B12|nr:uncharacterized protein BX661DRAFT_191852 [Kickxella alabastrina]KAI7818258.1 hypothetical protein BX661DRAFT_191852 [Kickxella alabastrina]
MHLCAMTVTIIPIRMGQSETKHHIYRLKHTPAHTVLVVPAVTATPVAIPPSPVPVLTLMTLMTLLGLLVLLTRLTRLIRLVLRFRECIGHCFGGGLGFSKGIGIGIGAHDSGGKNSDQGKSAE